MAYSQKSKKRDYKKIELENFKKQKHKGFFDYEREAERITFHAPQYIHRVGNIVEHKGKIMVVKKVTSKGVYLQSFDKDNLLENKLDKPIFVKESIYEKTTEPRPAWLQTMPLLTQTKPVTFKQFAFREEI